MMAFAELLRKVILTSAISGKVTEQYSIDGNADDEIQKLLAGHHREEPCDLDDKPFDIPDNWTWCALCDIGAFSSGKTPDMSNPAFWSDGNVQWFTSKDMKRKYLTDSKMKISETAKQTMKTYQAGTLLLVVRSGILKHTLPVCMLTVDATINQDIKAFSLLDSSMAEYLYFALKGLETHILQNYTKRVTTVESLRFDDFSKRLPIPIPPKKEQQRIVDRVNVLMGKLDEFSEIEQKLITLKANFPSDMRGAILQAAMQGKLTEQLEHDSSVENYIDDVMKTQAQLINEGKAKRNSKISPITEDEIPYDIPSSWRWLRFGELVNFSMGKTPPRGESAYWHNDIPWVSIADMPESNIILQTSEKVSNLAFKSKFGSIYSPKGTLLMSFKLTVGRVSILGMDAVHNEAIISIFPVCDSQNIVRDYLFKILPFVSRYGDSKDAIKGKTLNSTSLTNMLIPLPPIEEQHRIVERLDALLPICDTLVE